MLAQPSPAQCAIENQPGLLSTVPLLSVSLLSTPRAHGIPNTIIRSRKPETRKRQSPGSSRPGPGSSQAGNQRRASAPLPAQPRSQAAGAAALRRRTLVAGRSTLHADLPLRSPPDAQTSDRLSCPVSRRRQSQSLWRLGASSPNFHLSFHFPELFMLFCTLQPQAPNQLAISR